MNKYQLHISFKGVVLVKVFLQSHRTATKTACGGVNDMKELNIIEKYREDYIRKIKEENSMFYIVAQEYKISSEFLIHRYQTFLRKNTFPWETRGAPFLV